MSECDWWRRVGGTSVEKKRGPLFDGYHGNHCIKMAEFAYGAVRVPLMEFESELQEKPLDETLRIPCYLSNSLPIPNTVLSLRLFSF